MDKYAVAAKLMAIVQKAGARHSAKDNDMIQEMHDRACELGARCNCEGVTYPMLKAMVEKHGTHDQKAHGRRHGVGGLREFAKGRGYQVRQVAGKGGKTEFAITNKRGDKMRAGGLTEARKLITSARKMRKASDKKLAEQRKLFDSPIARAIRNRESLRGFSEKELRKTYLDLALKDVPHLTRAIDNELRGRRGDFSNFAMGNR